MTRRKQNPTLESSESTRKMSKTSPERGAPLFSGVNIDHARESCTIQLRGGTLHIRYRDGIPSISLNGKPLVHPGTQAIVTVAAPVKYTEEHFKQVDTLIQGGWSINKAAERVCDDNAFGSVEGFTKQYRKRWLDRKIIPSNSHDGK